MHYITMIRTFCIIKAKITTIIIKLPLSSSLGYFLSIVRWPTQKTTCNIAITWRSSSYFFSNSINIVRTAGLSVTILKETYWRIIPTERFDWIWLGGFRGVDFEMVKVGFICTASSKYYNNKITFIEFFRIFFVNCSLTYPKGHM
jgi:hypothetical protein